VGKEHRKTASIEEIKRAKQAGARASCGARDSADVCAIKDSLNAQQAVSDIGRRLGRERVAYGGLQRWIRAEFGKKAVALSDAVIADEKGCDSTGRGALEPAAGAGDADAVHRGGLLRRVTIKKGTQREEARANPRLGFARECGLDRILGDLWS
jgi:hypothetical protein